jgi:hypothetical protein
MGDQQGKRKHGGTDRVAVAEQEMTETRLHTFI